MLFVVVCCSWVAGRGLWVLLLLLLRVVVVVVVVVGSCGLLVGWRPAGRSVVRCVVAIAVAVVVVVGVGVGGGVVVCLSNSLGVLWFRCVGLVCDCGCGGCCWWC